MPTIKEVAKKACVSIGTVSNVLNGKKVKEELRVAVQEAIDELNYTPHAVARSLKSKKTNTIALIMPGLMDSYSVEFIKHTERILRESGYNISLQLTNNSIITEDRALDSLMGRRFDGVILYSCREGISAKIKRLIQTGLPVVFLEKDNVEHDGINFVASDNRDAAREALGHLAGLGHKRIALLTGRDSFSETTLVRGYQEALPKHGFPLDENLLKYIVPTKENAFKEVFALLQMERPPTAVLLANNSMVDGVYEAAFLNQLSIPEDLSLIALAEKTWLKYGNILPTSIERPIEKVSRAVCDLLISNIREAAMFEVKRYYIKSEFTIRSTCAPAKSPEWGAAYQPAGEKIKVLLLDSPAAHAIKMLLPDFRDSFGIDAALEVYHFKDLYRLTESELVQESPQYDVFMVDISRFHAMCETGSIADITGEVAGNEAFSQDQFIEGLFDSYCAHKGKYYGLPFMPGTQVLFYRKDLFSNRALNHAYYRMFNEVLRPPLTWNEFNKVASFFTRAINPDSPVPYGVTMAARLPVFVTSEFCPRKWAYGARSFDENGNVSINGSEALHALKNFIKSYHFAPPWALENDWDDEINDFCSKQCAMVIQYESHSTRIGSQMGPDFKGCVGYGIVPGGKPLLGGWSLVLNRHGKNRNKSLEFIKWACGRKLAVPYSLLGGTTARKSYYKSSDLGLLYPWLNVAYQSYKLARKRSNTHERFTAVGQGNYEDILGEEIKKAVTGAVSPVECLSRAEVRLKELANS